MCAGSKLKRRTKVVQYTWHDRAVMSTRNSSALARAKSANRSGSLRKTSYKSLEDVDDNVALGSDDLSTAIASFFGDDVMELRRRAEPEVHEAASHDVTTPAEASSNDVTTPADGKAKTQLLATLAQKFQESESSFQGMRGLLKKRGGAARFSKVTWHWRSCVLHKHALTIHDGKDRPTNLRSVVPLKHVLRVERATAEESGDRSFAFTVFTDLEGGRSWVFCCMNATDLDAWLAALHVACALTHAGGLTRSLNARD